MQLNPEKLHENILELAEKNSFSVDIIYKGNPVPIVALTKKASISPAPNVYISAGIHGDEPAGPLVIRELLKEAFFEDGINWYLIPMLNPEGLALGTRENADRIDLNRDYNTGKTKEVAAHLKWLKKKCDINYDLTITLHEDWESPGFYCYAIVPSEYQRLLTQISQAVEKISPLNLSEEIEGAKAKGGFIHHDTKNFEEVLNNRQDWPEAFLLIKNRPEGLHFTFETASAQPVEQRIKTHCAAIKTVIDELKKLWPKKALKKN